MSSQQGGKRKPRRKRITFFERKVGAKIKQLRLIKDWTQERLSDRVNKRGTIEMTQQRLSQIEGGAIPSTAELFAIAWALNVDVNVFDVKE
jgi:transcriptional regulator with XRE-family HTH domain